MSEQNSTSEQRGAGDQSTVEVSLEARLEQHLIPRGESFRHIDFLVRGARPAASGGRDREPLNLALVIDRSGSMGGEKIKTAKRAAMAVIDGLDERDRAAVVVFDDQMEVLQRAAQVTATVKHEIRSVLKTVDARNSTALHEGWLTGCRAIASEDLMPSSHNGVARCFLLTDGLANVGLSDPELIAAQAADIRNRAGIGTSTFGIGDDYAEELLGPMAEAGGGRFHHLRTSREIATTFVNELGELLATVATSIKLELEVEPGVIVEVVSTYWAAPAADNPARWTIGLGDLFGGEERHAIVRLGFMDQPHREEQAVRARIAWTAGGTEHTSEWVEVHFTYADDEAVAQEQVNAGVIEVAGQHLVDRTQREALRMSKSGDVAGALYALRTSSERIGALSKSVPSLAPELDDMAQFEQEIEEGPLLSARSKERYFRVQSRTHGKPDLRTGHAEAPSTISATPGQIQRLLSTYIKVSTLWPTPLPHTLPGEVIRDRARGCLVWGAAGDALGRPLNGQRPDEIRTRLGPNGLTRFLPPMGSNSGPTGAVTDATCLMLELARSLLANDGRLHVDDFTRRLALWKPQQRSVEPATEEALHMLAEGVPWWEAGSQGTFASGAAVRVAPIGLLHAFDASPLELRQDAALSALPTHRDTASVTGAIAMAAAIGWLLREVARGAERVDAVDLCNFVASTLLGVERQTKGALPRLADRLSALPQALTQVGGEPFGQRLKQGTNALDDVPTAFLCFLRSPDDPRRVVEAAANGGYAASAIASMAGQLAGAWCGAERIWQDARNWWEGLEYRDDILGIGEQLSDRALTGQEQS